MGGIWAWVRGPGAGALCYSECPVSFWRFPCSVGLLVCWDGVGIVRGFGLGGKWGLLFLSWIGLHKGMNSFKVNVCGMLRETVHTDYSFVLVVSVTFVTTSGFICKVVVSCRDGL